jgi:hypothetical protein
MKSCPICIRSDLLGWSGTSPLEEHLKSLALLKTNLKLKTRQVASVLLLASLSISYGHNVQFHRCIGWQVSKYDVFGTLNLEAATTSSKAAALSMMLLSDRYILHVITNICLPIPQYLGETLKMNAMCITTCIRHHGTIYMVFKLSI